MRSGAIIITGVGFQDLTQMHLAQDNDVVHTLAPDRSDQPFGKAILPRRGWCGRSVPDAHGAQSAGDQPSLKTIPLAAVGPRGPSPNELPRSFIPAPLCPRALRVVPTPALCVSRA